MTDFTALLRIGVDATGMVAGDQALDRLVNKGSQAEAKVVDALNKVSESGKRAGKGLQEAEVAAKRTASSMQAGAVQAAKAGQEVNKASGYTANLTSQFNDIAVMMAAGQNPLQLAMQQGTQITQVLQQMGGGVGSVKALGSAFMAMVSPISLVTLGVIGFGAAATQWFMDSGEKAKSLSDRMDDLKSTFDAYKSAADMANLATGEAAAKFGIAAAQAARYQQVVADINRMSLDQGFKGTGQGMIDTLGVNFKGGPTDIANLASASEFFGLGSNVQFGAAAKQLRAELIPLTEALYDFRDATNVEDRIAALEIALTQAAEVAQMDGKISSGEAELLDTLQQTLETLLLLRNEEEKAGRSRLDMAQEYGGAMRQQWEERARYAADEIDKLNQQAELNRLVAMFGEGSVVVTRARVQAEREAYEEIVKSKVGSNELADGLMEAWDKANGVASVDLDGKITLATNATWSWAEAMADVSAEISGILSAISSLGGGMISNAGKFVELEALKAGKTAGQAARARKEYEVGKEYDLKEASAGNWFERLAVQGERAVAMKGLELDDQLGSARSEANKRERDANKKPRSGGGGPKRNSYEKDVFTIQKETEALLAQADAVAKIVAAGGDWEHALRVVEEEQQLLIEAQRAGVALTPEIKASIRSWAEEYVAAEDHLEGLKDRITEFADMQREVGAAFKSGFSEWISGAKSLQDALAGVISRLADMAASRAFDLLWDGGGKSGGGGGILGSFVGSIFGGFKASGGPVSSGKGYIVGEEGPEWFEPGTSGTIVPNHALGGGGAPVINLSIDARGAVEGEAERFGKYAQQMIGPTVSAAVAKVRDDAKRGKR